jgi:hypothetical protein
MTIYTLLWLIVFLFIIIVMLTSVLFFRHKSSQPAKDHDLDSILFKG